MGHVVGWIDLLRRSAPPTDGRHRREIPFDVANGIAYDSAGDRIFVTGKYWPVLYQIRIGGRK